MSDDRTAVGFSATEAFHRQADEDARRLGMTRATFIATVVEFALDDREFFMSAFIARAMKEATMAWDGGDLYTVGPRTKSVQLLLNKKELRRLDELAQAMNRSRSEVLATLAEEGFVAQRAPIELAKKKWFRDFWKFLEGRGAFVDVLPKPV